MKGIVFNLLQDVVQRHRGEDAWDELIKGANVSGAYTSLGNYSDEELFSIINAACEQFQMSRKDVLRWFGREAMFEMSRRYPSFFLPYDTSRSFVLSVNDFIHPEVRKLYAGADCPYFNFLDAPEGGLALTYRSPRQLCHLAEGFVEGAAIHYDDRVRFTHIKCLHDGDDHCRFEITWLGKREITCTEV